MRLIALFVALIASAICLPAMASDHARAPRLSPGVAQRVAGLQGRLGPRTRAFIGQEAARVISGGAFSLVQIRSDIADADLGVNGGGDIDALVQLVLLQAAVDAESALRGDINALQWAVSQKKPARDAVEYARRRGKGVGAQPAADYVRSAMASAVVAPIYSLDSPTGLTGLDQRIQLDQADMDAVIGPSDMPPLRLQMMLDRRMQMLQLLSNLLKAASDTASVISSNLK